MAVVQAGGIELIGAQTMSADAGGEAVGCDLDELYRALSTRLERIVRVGVQAPDSLIEDACQFAWARLVHHRARVRRETALAWLVKTALHEAFKLLRRHRREQSLDAELQHLGELPVPDLRPGPAELYEQRERLRLLDALPVRQQRLLWMYGLGFKYEEIAARDGATTRTVERQLARARARLRQAAGE